MISSTESDTLIAVSDLHLGVGPGPWADDPTGSFHQDKTFSRFIAHILAGGGRPPPDLVLLGDIFELPGGHIEGRRRGRNQRVAVAHLQARLDRIADHHSIAFDALAGFLDHGGRIAIVPGNHDPGIGVPQVAQHLRWLLARRGAPLAAIAGVRVHPWYYRWRGLVHAQHGHQLHDLNAGRSPLQPYRFVDANQRVVVIDDPIGAVIHRMQERGPGAVNLVRATAELVSVAAHSAVAASLPMVPPSAESPRSARLDPATHVAMRELHRYRPWWIAARLAKRCVATARGWSGEPDAHLIDGARRLHGILQARGHDVPFYLLGHSHIARMTDLADGATYVNTGSWSTWGPQADQPGLPFVRIKAGSGIGADGDRSRASLHWWPKDHDVAISSCGAIDPSLELAFMASLETDCKVNE